MSFLGTGSSNDQKQSNNLLNYNAQAATPASQGAQASGNSSLNTGMQYLNSFSNTLAAPTNYFQNLLSGNKAQTTAALAPDINRINDQNTGTLQSTSTLTPRGGGRSSTLFNLPFAGTTQTAGLYNGARAGAAQGLTGIAGEQGQVGTQTGTLGANLLNTGANYLNAGTTAASDLGGQAGQQRQQSANAFSSLGQGVYGLLTGGATSIINGVKNTAGAFGGG